MTAPLPFSPANLDRVELATILAALRLLQCMSQLPASLSEIMTDSGALAPLSLDQIDALCERLNTGPD